jgi:outer membrane lipoprotein-sorting protein
MKKIFLITVLLTLLCGNVFSQTGRKLMPKEKQLFEQRMMAEAKQIRTLQCSFVQEKVSSLVAGKAISKGSLLYQSPDKLRWEYTSPAPSTLILNGNKAMLLDKNGKKLGNERVLKQLGGIIVSMINGSGLAETKQFSTEYYELDNTQMQVVLTPVQKRLKDFYSHIEMKIDRETMLANEIIMAEKSGDRTVVFLQDKSLNKTLSTDKFMLR